MTLDSAFFVIYGEAAQEEMGRVFALAVASIMATAEADESSAPFAFSTLATIGRVYHHIDPHFKCWTVDASAN
eukprot:SAG31_NODE_43392_length_267_cov_0.720238_1_plen_72_part_01